MEKTPKILVVDDHENNLHLMQSVLSRTYTLVFAMSGAQALEIARRERPDLILLDVMMPEMDGYDVCRRLKAIPDLAQIPVIFVSALGKTEDEAKGFEAGCVDYITKPISIALVKARIATHLQTVALSRQREALFRRMALELQDAAEIQRQLLPSVTHIERLANDYALALDHRFEPSSELGGDLWGVVPINDRAVAFYICDFAGHGVSAALNTVRLHTIIRDLPAPNPTDPASFVGEINRKLMGQIGNRQYATFLFAVIDIAAGTLTYCGAGSPNPVMGADSGDISILNGSGVPLGLVANAAYENRSAEFTPGSFLFFYSDALSESCDAQGNQLGTEGIARLVNAARHTSESGPCLSRIFDHLASDAIRPSADDVTAVWIEFATTRRPAPGRPSTAP